MNNIKQQKNKKTEGGSEANPHGRGREDGNHNYLNTYSD